MLPPTPTPSIASAVCVAHMLRQTAGFLLLCMAAFPLSLSDIHRLTPKEALMHRSVRVVDPFQSRVKREWNGANIWSFFHSLYCQVEILAFVTFRRIRVKMVRDDLGVAYLVMRAFGHHGSERELTSDQHHFCLFASILLNVRSGLKLMCAAVKQNPSVFSFNTNFRWLHLSSEFFWFVEMSPTI